MSWIRNSPFQRDEDPVQHMIALLSTEAEKSGVPFTDEERVLLGEQADFHPLPDDFRERVCGLIANLLREESETPKSFNNSIQWADPHYPNIVALGEEVGRELGAEAYPELRGWNRVKDKAQLVGCGCLVVLLMFALVTAAGYYLGWKYVSMPLLRNTPHAVLPVRP